MSDSGKTVMYLRTDRNAEVDRQEVFLGDIAEIACTDRNIISSLKQLPVFRFEGTGTQRNVISVLAVISVIHRSYPQIIIQNLGETDVIITFKNKKTQGSLGKGLKIVFVTAVTFFGAAFSIMAFNNDVDVTKLFGQLHMLITGRQTDGFTVLEITYSIGLTAGILIFFNHFGKKRFTSDPTPMEVQMRLYENDIQTALIEDSSRKGEELDADHIGSAGSSGSHRT